MAWGLTWKERLLDLILPRICLECREDLPQPAGGPLCGGCLRSLRPLPRESRSPSLSHVSPVRAAFPYRSPLPSLLYAFKYRGSLPAGRALGDWMAGALARRPELRQSDVLVPVPLHPARQRERGFNQARVLAERVARAARAPVLDALARVRNTPAQWRLSRFARARRISGAFAPAADVRGKRVLLIDDVLTSGGTLEGCGEALHSAGAASVAAFVLALS